MKCLICGHAQCYSVTHKILAQDAERKIKINRKKRKRGVVEV